MSAVTPRAGSGGVVVEPAVSDTGVVVFADTLGREVAAGERIADLVDPVSGESTPLCSPVDGLHFARELQRWAQAGQSVAKVAGRQALRSGKLLSA